MAPNALILLLLSATAPLLVAAQWPNAPYIDLCSELLQTTCTKTSYCKWFEVTSPNCYNTNYEAQYPPLNLQPPNNIVSSFFTFSYGSHLSEGSINAVYYNYNVTECALECMMAANPVIGTSQRCLSFDFYPFEAPIAEAPYFESLERGVCALNTANRDNARLRNEDQGCVPWSGAPPARRDWASDSRAAPPAGPTRSSTTGSLTSRSGRSATWTGTTRSATRAGAPSRRCSTTSWKRTW